MLPRLLPCLVGWVCLFLFNAVTYAGIITFSNTASISIPARGLANPYPSTINVTGVTGLISNFTLTLDGISHSYIDDVSAVVVSPEGEAVLLFSGAGPNANNGGPFRITNQTWTFDDRAPTTLPETTLPVSGTYRPGLFEYDDLFDEPGPGLVYGFTFAPFLTGDPNGQWSIFIKDFNAGDAGLIARGWSISFDMSTAAVPEPGLLGLGLLGPLAWRRWRRR